MHKKIIVLIAPPRSLSTAFLRMMAEREDFHVINEPTCSIFNRSHYPITSAFYSEDANTSYAEVKSAILSPNITKHIFVKEMSFSFEEFISQEPNFIKNPNIFFVLLLRDPHYSIISFYKKIAVEAINFIIDDFPILTGYQSLHAIFNSLKKEAIRPPYILNANQLITDTYASIQAFCKYVNIPYHTKYLHWPPLTFHHQFNKWQENKKQEFIHHWHDEALNSNGFHHTTHYEIDENGMPTFAEIQNEDHRKKCIAVYKTNKKLYDLMNH